MRWLFLILLTSCTGAFIAEPGSVEVFFCDQTNCTALFLNETQNEDLQCAWYRVNDRIAERVSQERVILDEDAFLPNARIEHGRGLMHNKFCTYGNKVWTGSWNPSQEMTIPNNVVVITSKSITKAYAAEFRELWKGTFHGGKKGKARAKLNAIPIEVRFCPEDNCKELLLDAIKNAKHSIHFMTFSFTDDDIGKAIKEKSQDLHVKGIFDPRKDKKHSEYERLKDFSVIRHVHHKTFIIDEEVVITGSYNPTKNGNERNDENVVLIKDKEVASKFMKEFNRII